MIRRLCLLPFLLICSAGLVVAGGDPVSPGRPYDNSHFRVVDSVRFHYRTWNEDLLSPKGNVLLIHGFTGSTFCYRKNIDTLVQAGYRVVAVDLPGFGYSDRNPAVNQSQSNRARLLWKLLEAIDGNDSTRWNIVGHSMGGGTAESMAIMHPRSTKSLLIIAGMVFNNNSLMLADLTSLLTSKKLRKMQLNYLRSNMICYDYLKKQLKKAYGREPDSSEVMGYLVPMQIPGSAECLISVFLNAKEVEKQDSKGLSALPATMIWGSKDSRISPAIAKRFKKANPSVGLTMIKGAGHIPMETHPAGFNRLMRLWLDQENPGR